MSALAYPPSPENKQQWYIQIAKDISEQSAIIEDTQESLIIILLLGMVVSVVISILVTRKNLQPLLKITDSIHRITVTQLKQRLEPALWPSELSVLALAFNRMLDRIEEGFTRLSQFSSDLAHELRTPINNLIGEAEIALSKSRSNEDYRSTLESSLEECHRLAHMIENLLFLARAENPSQKIDCSWINVQDYLRIYVIFMKLRRKKNKLLSITVVKEGSKLIQYYYAERLLTLFLMHYNILQLEVRLLSWCKLKPINL